MMSQYAPSCWQQRERDRCAAVPSRGARTGECHASVARPAPTFRASAARTKPFDDTTEPCQSFLTEHQVGLLRRDELTLDELGYARLVSPMASSVGAYDLRDGLSAFKLMVGCKGEHGQSLVAQGRCC